MLNNKYPQIKEKIKQIAANDYSVHMISKNGKLFSFGNDTLYRTGVIGLGHNYTVTHPTLNPTLVDKNIVFISLSEKHCLASEENGSLYTWGSGPYGELIDKIGYNVNTPILTKEQYVIKAAAGENYTAILYNKGNIYYYGKLSSKSNITYNKSSLPSSKSRISSTITKNSIFGMSMHKFVDIIPGSNIICLITNTGKIFL